MWRVKKYGGSSVVENQKIDYIAQQCKSGDVIVLSAPKGRTDALYANCPYYAKSPSVANHMIALGEMESCFRLQLALGSLNKPSRIMKYHEIGLFTSTLTDARVEKIVPSKLLKILEQGTIPIVPGFQVSTYDGELALLSRGGSDETAVALAIALDACCTIYSDISQIHDRNQAPLAEIQYQDLMALINGSQAPMSQNSIELAKRYQKRLVVRHWKNSGQKTLIF